MRITLLLLFISTSIFSQDLTGNEISKYIKTIDSLKRTNNLKKYSNQQMSPCGGSVDGYFYKDKLVLIESQFNAELGFSSQIVYYKDSTIYKIIYREHFAEWGKYSAKYPSSDTINSAKMTYTDTVYTFTMGNQPKSRKQSNKKTMSGFSDNNMLPRLISCARKMKSEIEEEKKNQNQ